ncbi:MAG: Acetyl-coenzyme A carboxylase carboxyl transferase subunit alpha [Alphaproteobacteria bacterium MarineAlpha10_Bin3]|jgi:acetyl-CoA carboxylase carboxyl transferase subunit alpha|nr:MAG: Acetyl-coenzyme A carboxylase carboxyl transferase subunit alpha [Alphaproteobacteria bacterium MarineAlpha10_Bin3]PPR75579.1 MAG: Acetyl-coenzyme A carboxylase carboxyl transferase subunit alpha [Alphaproteobacteria bacterium MarineAlpha4_Bin1]
MKTFLDFERPIAELENKIEELRHLSDVGDINIADEVGKMQNEADRLLQRAYANLTRWQKVQVARHPERPHCVDYIDALIDDFTALAGDRAFAEDNAMIGGIGRFRGYSCVVIGTEKGADTTARVAHNFGMAQPEGYRKARRLMQLADRFHLPVVTFVDTTGAYPGIGAEERGQAEAIARSIEACLALETPMVCVIIGEGGSGGAMALAAANTVIMLEHAIYSVIAPEACSSILWRSVDYARDAADALRLTAQDMLEFGVIDEIVPEPMGGAHRDPAAATNAVGDALALALEAMRDVDGATLRRRRREKFLQMDTQVA